MPNPSGSRFKNADRVNAFNTTGASPFAATALATPTPPASGNVAGSVASPAGSASSTTAVNPSDDVAEVTNKKNTTPPKRWEIILTPPTIYGIAWLIPRIIETERSFLFIPRIATIAIACWDLYAHHKETVGPAFGELKEKLEGAVSPMLQKAGLDGKVDPQTLIAVGLPLLAIILPYFFPAALPIASGLAYLYCLVIACPKESAERDVLKEAPAVISDLISDREIQASFVQHFQKIITLPRQEIFKTLLPLLKPAGTLILSLFSSSTVSFPSLIFSQVPQLFDAIAKSLLSTMKTDKEIQAFEEKKREHDDFIKEESAKGMEIEAASTFLEKVREFEKVTRKFRNKPDATDEEKRVYAEEEAEHTQYMSEQKMTQETATEFLQKVQAHRSTATDLEKKIIVREPTKNILKKVDNTIIPLVTIFCLVFFFSLYGFELLTLLPLLSIVRGLQVPWSEKVDQRKKTKADMVADEDAAAIVPRP